MYFEWLGLVYFDDVLVRSDGGEVKSGCVGASGLRDIGIMEQAR